MIASPSIDALRDAMAPVEALRGEQSQLETWVRDSFTALDSLHGELTEWQRDLTRQQAELDQRDAALADADTERENAVAAKLREELAKAHEETRQLEEENGEQLQALDDLDRQLAVALAELKILRKHHEELSVALATERERGADEHRHWTNELKELRRLMERQSAMLDRLAGEQTVAAAASPVSNADEQAAEGHSEPDDVAARTAELRRRANSRRAQRNSS